MAKAGFGYIARYPDGSRWYYRTDTATNRTCTDGLAANPDRVTVIGCWWEVEG